MNRWSWLARLLPALGQLLALILVFVGFAVADQIWGQGRFVEMRNLRVIAMTTAPLAVAALGMTMIIIAGGIDLSAGTAAMLSATILACTLKAEWHIAFCICATLLTGGVCGLVNGLLISSLKIPPFIVTLGTMTIFLGIAKHLAAGSTVFVDRVKIPGWLLSFTSTMPPDWHGNFPNLAIGFWFAILLAMAVGCMLHYSVIGRHLFAIGSNEQTAILCGIPIFRTKTLVYGIAGILTGLAGLYMFSLVKMANPIEGIGKELKFIAAVVIGGGSLSGGRGTVLGTLVGASMMGVIGSGCDQLEISNSTQDIIIGCIIIAAVTVDQSRQRFGKRSHSA
jgi:ribose transport system permease protein